MDHVNAEYILQQVVAQLERRYGRSARVGRSRLLRFGSSLTCSINYSKLLRGHKYFFGLSRDVVDPNVVFPETALGDFVLLVCGSDSTVLVMPRSVVLEAMTEVSTRRLDVFQDDESFVLQTTGHPKLDVSAFLNTFPAVRRDHDTAEPSDAPTANNGSDRAHIRIQWGLIRLGRAEGRAVWVPPQDRNLSYQQERFDANTLARLPRFGFDENTRRIVENIDVLWLDRNVICKAFEIESTTVIYSGLLRLNDLVLAQPNNRIELYIAAPRARRERVRAQLTRPTFQPLLGRCQFASFEDIDEDSARLDSFPVGSGARVTGLVRGEQFSLPEHYMYPSNV